MQESVFPLISDRNKIKSWVASNSMMTSKVGWGTVVMVVLFATMMTPTNCIEEYEDDAEYTAVECEKRSAKSDKEMFEADLWKREEPEVPKKTGSCSTEVKFGPSECENLLKVKQIVIAPRPKSVEGKKKRTNKLKHDLHALKLGLIAKGVCKDEAKDALVERLHVWYRIGQKLKYDKNFITIP